MSYDKNKVIDLVLHINSLLIRSPSRFNYQYLPEVVDKLYKEMHSNCSEESEKDVEEMFKLLNRLRGNDEVRITEMNSKVWASGNGEITIYYNFKPLSFDEHIMSTNDE